MPQLVVVEGPNMGQIYQVNSSTTLGSAEQNSIILQDRRIAEKQAYFIERDDVFCILTCEDAREIMVNSELVNESPLHHGDMVTIGETIMLFTQESAPVTPPIVAPDSANIDDSMIRSRHKQYEDPTLVIDSFKADDKPTQRLKTLYSVANAISNIYDQQTLLEKILELIFRVFEADRGLILLREDGKSLLTPQVHRNRLSRTNAMPHLSRTILNEVLRTKDSVLTMDAKDDERFLSGMSIMEQNIRSAMCVPLLPRDQLLGIISIDSSSRSQAFVKEDLDLLTGIAHQASTALENVRIYTRRKQHTEDLISLGKATQQLSSYLRKEKIHKEAVKLAWRLVRARRVSLLCLERKQEEPQIQLVYSRGIDPREWREVGHPPTARGLVGHTIIHNRSLLVRDLDSDIPPEVQFESDEKYATDSFVIVPISAKGEVFDFETPAFGALCVTDKDDGSRFNERDLQLLSILASQIGIALTNAELYERATIDDLTRLYVRRYFFQRLDELVERASHKQEPLILIMLDLDHFKQCNDNHGHQAGDVILRETGELMQSKMREQDIPARYGGEEFCILLYDTDIQTSVEIAERIRTEIEAFAFNSRIGPEIRVTVSIGVAELGPDDSPKSLIKKADDALYMAKEAGRNQVVVFQS